MFDFWVFVGLFIAGVTLLWCFWRRLIKDWKDTPKEINYLALILVVLLTGVLGTYMLMGAVHFVQMILFLIC